ncbi:MAG: ribosomal RNA small subunit methyltransferase A [Williamsia sp.]|nr:ribosomal RNA small subunit methyltransferase A [Williamsia sp.]
MYTLKKSLGQHFLHDENVCRRILAALQEKSFNRLLEVGPGGGALTKYLVKIPDVEFKAVELDSEKVNYLLQTYPELQDKLVQADFLQVEEPFTGPFTVIGNFPYNISTQILFRIIEWKEEVECMIGMFQKEVAQRVAAPPGNKTYGVLSILVQAFFDVQYLFEVQENSFYPPPQVKSAVIRLLPRSALPAMKSEQAFFTLVKTAFNQRRKMLRNSVKTLFAPPVLLEEIFNKRPEQLGIDEFAALTYKMNQL